MFHILTPVYKGVHEVKLKANSESLPEALNRLGHARSPSATPRAASLMRCIRCVLFAPIASLIISRERHHALFRNVVPGEAAGQEPWMVPSRGLEFDSCNHPGSIMCIGTRKSEEVVIMCYCVVGVASEFEKAILLLSPISMHSL